VNLKLVLFDRDGVINSRVNDGYINSLEDFVINLEVFDFLKFLDASKSRTAIVTNQQGLGKGDTSFPDFYLIQGAFAQACIQRNITPPQLFYCPHLEGTCECRKPKTGMLRAAMATFDVQPEECLLIGDSKSDIECAQNLGVASIHFGFNVMCEPTCKAQLHTNDFGNLAELLQELMI
jgi:D-glycero-D-manno-heptose 1,7-bisphosphate phosphatase